MLGFYAASESVVSFTGTAPNRLSILLLQQEFGGQPFGTHPRARCGIQSVYWIVSSIIAAEDSFVVGKRRKWIQYGN